MFYCRVPSAATWYTSWLDMLLYPRLSRSQVRVSAALVPDSNQVHIAGLEPVITGVPAQLLTSELLVLAKVMCSGRIYPSLLAAAWHKIWTSNLEIYSLSLYLWAIQPEFRGSFLVSLSFFFLAVGYKTIIARCRTWTSDHQTSSPALNLWAPCVVQGQVLLADLSFSLAIR